MGRETAIQWCDSTVNPTMGCDGCELWNPKRKSCYAGVMHGRYGGKSKGYAPTFEQVTLFPGRMAEAAKWPDLRGKVRADKPWIPAEMPRLVFISDMSDALSRAVSFEYLKAEVIDVVGGWPHIGMWLTKQPRRMAEFSDWLMAQGIEWPANLWPGTSLTTAKTWGRVENLCHVGNGDTVRFLSCEPMLGELRFVFEEPGPDDDHYLLRERIRMVILGGESGAQPRMCHMDWFRRVIRECSRSSVRAFLKQAGAYIVDRNDVGFEGDAGEWPMDTRYEEIDSGYQGALVRIRLNDSHGGDWSEWPEDLRVREFPEVATEKHRLVPKPKSCPICCAAIIEAGHAIAGAICRGCEWGEDEG